MTWLRNSEASPEVLKQAARAQRHQKATADSDKYDKEYNDRLVAAAVQFCEQHAKTFQGPPPPQTNEPWALLAGQAVQYTFKAAGDAVEGQRVYTVKIAYTEAMEPLPCLLRFPTVPGRAEPLLIQVNEALRGKTMQISVSLDAAGARKASFHVTSLQRKVEAAAGSANQESGNGGEGSVHGHDGGSGGCGAADAVGDGGEGGGEGGSGDGGGDGGGEEGAQGRRWRRT